MELETKENELMEFLQMLNDLTTSFPDILNNYFDENGLKREYREEKYQEIVIIDTTIKNNLEIITNKFQDIKNENDNEKVKNFNLIVGNTIDKLLQECTDFSLLFYTLTVDVILVKNGMNEDTLLIDASNLVKKYYMFVEKIKEYKNKITIFFNCYYN